MIERFEAYETFDETRFKNALLFNDSKVNGLDYIEVVVGDFKEREEGTLFKHTKRSFPTFFAQKQQEKEIMVKNICLKYGLSYRMRDKVIKVYNYASFESKELVRYFEISIPDSTIRRIKQEAERQKEEEKRQEVHRIERESMRRYGKIISNSYERDGINNLKKSEIFKKIVDLICDPLSRKIHVIYSINDSENKNMLGMLIRFRNDSISYEFSDYGVDIVYGFNNYYGRYDGHLEYVKMGYSGIDDSKMLNTLIIAITEYFNDYLKADKRCSDVKLCFHTEQDAAFYITVSKNKRLKSFEDILK